MPEQSNRIKIKKKLKQIEFHDVRQANPNITY